MTRSRRRKLLRAEARPTANRAVRIGIPLAASLMSVTSAVLAQAQSPASASAGGLEEVIVTAQKRTESLQDVPASITALGSQKLEELNVTDFDDYAAYLPSLAYTTGGPGFARVYFRGAAAGDNGNHSGSKPSVGIYLNEQPITTIQGALDVHLYDVERVEALAGPQGTLYGASSQAGTIRIITNRPQFDEFQAGYDLEGSTLEGGLGYVAEGFVNIPVSERAAVRLVGWLKEEPGYVDNVRNTRVFPTASELAGEEISIDNVAVAGDEYNDVETYGARAALRIDLNDSWTVTPSLMTQKQETSGAFNTDPNFGSLAIAKYYPEGSDDTWTQLALTVEGKISNLDLVYAGAYLDRDVDLQQDYSDYSYFYDRDAGYVLYNDAGEIINPSQYIQAKDRYKSQSHELRLSSAQDQRLRWVAGLFYQRQEHGIEQRYRVDDLWAEYEVSLWEDTLWLTEQTRVDRDYAVFGELTYDLTDQLSLIGGLRWFKAENSLEGFFGFGDGYSTSGKYGEALCSLVAGDEIGDESGWVPYRAVGTAPCKNLDKTVDEDGVTPKVNLTYKFDDARLVYVTYSEGFRPGGVNRFPGVKPTYDADYLENFEVGWKTSWLDDRLRFNGAVFWDKWDDFQFSFLGPNGLTVVVNGGYSRIIGLESDLTWAATDQLILSGGFSILDSELTEDFCKSLDDDGNPLPADQCSEEEFAPEGTQLPITPDFKANLTARYKFPVGSLDGHAQGGLVYNGSARSALLPVPEEALGGELSAYTLVDLSFGVAKNGLSAELYVNNVFDERAELTRFSQCDILICQQSYLVTNQPRTYGIRFGQRF